MPVPPRLRQVLVVPALRRRAIAVGLTAVLSPLPLVGTLGYESSVVLTAPLSLLGIGTGVDAIRAVRAREQTDDEPRSLVLVAGPAMLRDVLLLVGLTLGMLLCAQLWNRSCDPLDGLAFFSLGPALSAVLGGVCGLWGATIVRTDSRRRQLLAGFVPMLVSFLIGLRRIYADPVVFAHDPFWGYFAGPLYDEAVAITPRYLWFRAYNVVLALAAVVALEIWGRPDGTLTLKLHAIRQRPVLSGAFLALSIVGGWFGFRAEHHHFNATVDSLSRELGASLQTEHFVIHYSPSSAAARELDIIAAEHEFAWARLARRIGQEPEVPVHSFVFPNADRKRALMGAGRTEVSPPWRGHLYLNDYPFPHRVLHHELAHSFSAPLGDPLFGIAGRVGLDGLQINLALVEGFAEALAPRPRHGLDLHDQAAVLDRLGKRPPLASLMGLSFWGKSSRHAYAAAGSFCLWLVETRGVEPLVQLYSSAGDFSSSYGVPLEDLEAEWVAFLEARPIRPRDIEAQRQRYKKRAIFKRPCAHRSANLRKDALRAQARGDHETSLANFNTLCAIEPEQTKHQVSLAHAQAQAGLFDQALATLEEAAADPELTHTLASAIDERRGDLAVQRGDLALAREHYTAAVERSVAESVARRLQIKQLSTHTPPLAALVMDYYAPFDGQRKRASRATVRIYAATQIRERPPYGPLGWTLTGIELLSAQQGARAAEAFEHALDPAPGQEPLSTPELLRWAREGLLNASVRTRDYARARQMVELLLADPEIGNGHRYTYGLWGERIEFFESYRPAQP